MIHERLSTLPWKGITTKDFLMFQQLRGGRTNISYSISYVLWGILVGILREQINLP